jgi:Replication-relaxation
METATAAQPVRRPRFRRASEPPPFRLTDDDVEIVRQIARHRLIRSTHIAALVGRSLDRTNDRLMRLFHAGYVDRPRAQLDRFPTSGSAHYVYALADRGARLLRQHEDMEWRGTWSRKNRAASRPFIEHQIAVVDFRVALQRAAAEHSGIRLIDADEMNAAASRRQMLANRAPFSLNARLSHRGTMRETSVIPDLVFGLELPGGTRRNFIVEIDRGTMPVRRSDPTQTSIESKMRVYLAAHAARQHERLFGWKNFRVLIVTTDRHRVLTMAEALRHLHPRRGVVPSLFLFGTSDHSCAADPLAYRWLSGSGRQLPLI